MSRWAADYVVAKIKAAHPSASKPFVLGLPTGSTPLGLYQHLIDDYRQSKVSFQHIITFNMDEYVGLPETHPQSYHAFMWNNFFSHIDIQAHNVHILNGNATDTTRECLEYEKAIKEVGGIQLFLGGIGVDGHIAFNEPGSSLHSRTRLVDLTEDTIIANSRFFDMDLRKVPKQALTVGIGTILDAAEVMLLVNGHNKARALRHGVEEPISHKWAVSFLQTHEHAIIVCDEAACDELTVGTYKYFKEVENK